MVKPVTIDDFNFHAIRRYEGGQILKGYIPSVGRKSGVTIASGIDLKLSEDQFRRIVPDTKLFLLCKPYLGKSGEEAFDVLIRNPLIITKSLADKLDNYFVLEFGNYLARAYGQSTIPVRYKSIPEFADLKLEAKTVALSVAWHMGVGLRHAAPKFWGYFLMNDWISTQRELWNFYPGKAPQGFINRRRAEARMLLPLTGGEMHISPPTAYNPLAAIAGKNYKAYVSDN